MSHLTQPSSLHVCFPAMKGCHVLSVMLTVSARVSGEGDKLPRLGYHGLNPILHKEKQVLLHFT